MEEIKNKKIEGFNNYTIYENGDCIRNKSKNKLTPEISKAGKPFYRLLDNKNTRKMIPVGKLVAEAFIPNPNNYNEYINIDGDSKNNNVNNLKWVSDEEFIGSLDGEIWKDVVGYEDYYKVSNLGRIYSKRQVVVNKDGSVNKNKPPMIMKTVRDSKGYLKITFNLPAIGLKKTYKVHRIVAEAFIPNPNNLPQINHIDGIKDNNNIENLEWISNLDNRRHNDTIGITPENMRSIPVVMVDSKTGLDIKIFHSIHEAGTYLFEEKGLGKNVKNVRENIRRALKTNGTSYNYKWRRVK